MSVTAPSTGFMVRCIDNSGVGYVDDCEVSMSFFLTEAHVYYVHQAENGEYTLLDDHGIEGVFDAERFALVSGERATQSHVLCTCHYCAAAVSGKRRIRTDEMWVNVCDEHFDSYVQSLKNRTHHKEA